MPKFEINKTINCNLIIDCVDISEAQIWANKIVASIEDENGEIIDSSNFESFEAETIISEIKINIIEY